MQKKWKRVSAAVMAGAMAFTLLPTTMVSAETIAVQREDSEEEAPEIPDYTQYTVGELEEDRNYLVVTRDSDGELYALYASEGGAKVSSGSLNGKNGACTARLEITEDGVNARYLADDTHLDLEDLHFQAEDMGNHRFAFFASNENKSDNAAVNAVQSDDVPASPSNAERVDEAGKGQLATASNAAREDGKKEQLATASNALSENGKKEQIATDSNAEPDEDAEEYEIELLNDIVVFDAGEEEIWYLQLGDKMFGQEASALEFSGQNGEMVISSSNRTLSFNKKGDTRSGQFKDLITDFWGPKSSGDFPIWLYVEGEWTEPEPEIASGAPAGGTTQNQPFRTMTGTSECFRIPSLVTLEDGSLFAAIDARWNTTGDGGGLDTIISVSDDEGKTWNYSFPNFFNDSTNAWNKYATAFIDPVTVVGQDGTIYMLVDLFSGGNGLNSAAAQPERSTGYVEIDGTQRLAIYDSTKGQTDENYDGYVGDFDGEYAPVCSADSGEIKAYVDDHYYLYDVKYQPMYCQQLGSSNAVHQNVFFYNADWHVRNATYLWLVKSEDNGETWSAPSILNPMIRNADDPDNFYGVGPGRGLCLDDGTLMLPCYTFRVGGKGSSGQISSFIYSTDDGETWRRSENVTDYDHWSSESVLVQIDEDTVRQFYRDGDDMLTYTDHTRDGENWAAGEPVSQPDVKNTGNNQLSAIKYSEQIDGKDVIILSTATGNYVGGSNPTARVNGVLHVLQVNEDKSMTLISTFAVNKGAYGYSCLTELEDGSIGLLYETDDDAVVYKKFLKDDIFGNAISVTVPLYNTSTIYHVTPTKEELAALDTTFVTASIDENGNLVLTGVKEGTVRFVCGGVTYGITVVPEKMEEIKLKVGETKTIVLREGKITHDADSAIVKSRLKTIDTSANMELMLGDTKEFTGSKVPLETALYHFSGDHANGFTVSAETSSGVQVYMDLDNEGKEGDRYPSTTNAAAKTFVGESQIEGNFYLHDNNGQYWYFFRNGNNSFLTWTSLYTAEGAFMLFRPAQEGESSDEKLPDYVQVTRQEDVVEGDYLIVAEAGGDYFTLYPSDSLENRYLHVGKVQPALYYTLNLTGVSVGTSDVMADGMIYRIVVEENSGNGNTGNGGSSFYDDDDDDGGSDSGSSNGVWQSDQKGWRFAKNDGTYPVSTWYECYWNGEMNWYHFNAEGYLESGWFTDENGYTYYLHDQHDNHFGYMYTGWKWIGDKCYYFASVRTENGIPKGALLKNCVTPDGYRVDEQGAWMEN